MNNTFKYIFILFLAGRAFKGYSQTDSVNYISARKFLSADQKQFQNKIQYCDESGRVVETVIRNASPDGGDIISGVDYDEYGRKTKEWNPCTFPSNNGNFVDASTFKSGNTNFYSDDAPYKETYYKQSPLDIVYKEFQQGENLHYNDRNKLSEFYFNNQKNPMLNCLNFKVIVGDKIQIKNTGGYDNGMLDVVKITDEDGNINLTFKDYHNNVVLKRTILNGQNVDTYYVYDSAGKLYAVLPPLASSQMQETGIWAEDNALICKYAYLYKYDKWLRNTAKRLPGQDWIFTIYDRADRPLFSQNGNQRIKAQPEWSILLKDCYGRDAINGTCINSQKELENIAKSFSYVEFNSNINDYDCSNLPLKNLKKIKVTYYDNYSWMNSESFRNHLKSKYKGDVSSYFQAPKDTTCCTGLQTGYLNSVLGTDSVLYGAIFYDYRGRPIKNIKEFLGEKIQQTIECYDFSDNLISETNKLLKDGKETVEIFNNTYDNQSRLKRASCILNGKEQVFVENEYDGVGRLKETKLLNNGNLNKTYQYNVRNQLTSNKNALYSESLLYDLSDNPCYNGSISQYTFNYGNDNNIATYSYDALNRLIGSTLRKEINNEMTCKTSYNYDLHGNILNLQRYAPTGYNKQCCLIDKIECGYDGNQLVYANNKNSIFDYNVMHFQDGLNSLKEYIYDKNGNQIKDLNKKISKIDYNVLNLPSEIKFADGSSIKYLYDADGAKLQTCHNIVSYTIDNPQTNGMKSSIPLSEKQKFIVHEITDYVGSHIYQNNNLSKILISNGYITIKNNTPIYHCYLTDYLGNVRRVADGFGKVEQTNYYFPYGAQYNITSSEEGVQPYKFVGKELDRVNGLDKYDFGARSYDPILCRWSTVDPLAEKYAEASPYAYCKGNPVNRLDPDGRDIFQIDSKTGALTEKIEDKTKDEFRINNENPEQSKSLCFKYGTVGYQSFKKDNKSFDIFTLNGDENGNKLFEFMANNTKVEWSHLKTGESESGTNYVSSSHNAGSDDSFNYVMNNIMPSKEAIRAFDHNHPNGSNIPSGLYPGDTKGDVFVAKGLELRAEGLNQVRPTCNIYHAKNKYSTYSSKSKFSDFGRNPDGTWNICLPEFEVSAIRKK